ncbi:hypothetical protein H2199_008786 [Coniosporium tulheliwenetii]|uniref:Uncharacterized protein n=1 Tax=Coniosporium tulheliwenetii TaxID=3383036 RepID=A0ACC2YIJ7_9PEZI|nr:hypothetical protein H2199_008786 [Cladosporium sp. JES 115]
MSAALGASAHPDSAATLPSIVLRSCFPPPTHPDGSASVSPSAVHRVTLRHPGYDDRNNVLMVLQASDHCDGGIHHATALVACGIAAGNRWDGFFTKLKTGPRIDLPSDGILPNGDYYFHVPVSESEDDCPAESPYIYPIVPRFTDWSFPHNNLPPSWATLASASSDLNVPTRSSGGHRGCPHLSAEREDWFQRNVMDNYVFALERHRVGAIDDSSNALLLRSDIHWAFDQRRIVFVPKSSRLVAHVMSPVAELVRLYHNVQLHPLKGVPLEYLFTRLEPQGKSSTMRSASPIDNGTTSDASTPATSEVYDASDDAGLRTKEPCRLDRLRVEYLEKERQRSDPEGFWLKEQTWARKAMDSTLTSAGARRLYEFMGADVLDDP